MVKNAQVKKNLPPFKLIAHRGASGHAPENTRASILKACELGVDYIEIDVRLTSDLVPVVLHDASLKRICIKNPITKPIAQVSYPVLKKQDIGSWFHKDFSKECLITLTEAIQICKNRIPLMIEIKRCSHKPEVIVDSIFETLMKCRSDWKQTFIGSFSIPVLMFFQKKMRQCKLSIELIGIVDKTENINRFIDLGIKHLAIWHKLLTPKIVRQLIKQNVTVWTFTVNQRVQAEALAKLGVHGMISNFPDRLIEK